MICYLQSKRLFLLIAFINNVLPEIILQHKNKYMRGIKKNGSDKVPSSKTSEPRIENMIGQAIAEINVVKKIPFKKEILLSFFQFIAIFFMVSVSPFSPTGDNT